MRTKTGRMAVKYQQLIHRNRYETCVIEEILRTSVWSCQMFSAYIWLHTHDPCQQLSIYQPFQKCVSFEWSPNDGHKKNRRSYLFLRNVFVEMNAKKTSFMLERYFDGIFGQWFGLIRFFFFFIDKYSMNKLNCHCLTHQICWLTYKE